MEDFNDYFKENGINYEITAPYLLKQNRKAEKVNRVIIGSVYAIFAQQRLFKLLWDKIAKVIVYLRNSSFIS